MAVLFCVVPDNESSSVDPGGLKGCREAKLVLLVGEKTDYNHLHALQEGEVGVVM